MLLAKARQISHHIVGPLVVLWLLCQSMVLCAGLLGDSAGLLSSSEGESRSITHALASSNMVMPAAMNEHHGAEHHHSESQNMAMTHSGVDQTHHHSSSSDMAGSDMAGGDCCDEQSSYLSNSFYASIVFLLFFPLCWLIMSLGQRLKHSIYHREPPPRYNYPRNHLVNCTFLN